ncbi:hypothetical protein MBLNU230_g8004t1 [Neophaeotheca triangularis]
MSQANGGQINGHSLTNGTHLKARSDLPRPRTALVLYGSETGNAQDVAEEVGRLTERLRFETTVLDMDSAQLKEILKPTVIIFALSTTGQGEMPQNARSFWKTLLSSALRPGLLKRVRFTSFGLGDGSYAKYNVAHRMLCGRLTQLGAQSFCQRGEGNEQHPEGHSAGFREWIVQLKQALDEEFPLSDGLEEIAEDTFLEPKWKLALYESEKSLNPATNGNAANEEKGEHGSVEAKKRPSGADSKDSGAEEPPPDLLPIKDSHTSTILSNKRVTTSDHFQDVRVLDLEIDQELVYGPGAVAVIYPKNFPSDVNAFLTLMDWQSLADEPLQLTTTDPTTRTPSPLRHLNLSPSSPLTLRYLCTNILDIMSIPRRSFFANLAYFASTATEDEAYQKERLLELANPELIDELWDYTTRPKRTILEVMMDFTTIRIPWQYCLTALPHMRGRQFSIASGGAQIRPPTSGPHDPKTRVQLLVAIADPPSPIIKFRRRHGVCTRYIATLRPGQLLNITLQPGYLDVQASEMAVPIIMIGPGTGLAPMRSMIHQRLQWADQGIGNRPPGRKLAGDVLVFGCRSASKDFFFKEEWMRLEREEGLTVLTAFSRDPASMPGKKYVQDLIREDGNAGLIGRALVERHGKVYVCGSSGNMPKSVREALVEVVGRGDVGDGGGGMGAEAAEAFVDAMEKEGRYKQETW